MSAETLWEQWLAANPNRAICTHYHEAFVQGAEWMRSTLIALAEANEQAILESEGEGREWMGVHNLLIELRGTQ